MIKVCSLCQSQTTFSIYSEKLLFAQAPVSAVFHCSKEGHLVCAVFFLSANVFVPSHMSLYAVSNIFTALSLKLKLKKNKPNAHNTNNHSIAVCVLCVSNVLWERNERP